MTHKEAIEQALAILGPEAPLCSGCVEEWTEALRVLREALAAPQPSARQQLAQALKEDADYAWSWHCNLAMPIMDSTGVSHRVANEAAARLMQHLFGIDTSQHQYYKTEPDAPQPSAEPVAWMVTDIAGRRFLFRLEKPVVYEGETLIPLYPAPQPAKPAEQEPSLKQALTDPENQPNQFGVEFLMCGPKFAFKVGVQQFTLDYEPEEPGEFELMRDMLIHAFSTFTPDVKAEQAPAPVLTMDALRVEFERSHRGDLGLTRLSRGEYLSPAIETEWQQFVRKYTAPQPAIPPGYKLVPVEPTSEMLKAAIMLTFPPCDDGAQPWQAGLRWGLTLEQVLPLWAAILAASPEAPQPAKRVPLTDEEIYECERLAAIRYQQHKHSIRGQQITPADDPQWHFARAVIAAYEAKNGIGGGA